MLPGRSKTRDADACASPPGENAPHRRAGRNGYGRKGGRGGRSSCELSVTLYRPCSTSSAPFPDRKRRQPCAETGLSVSRSGFASTRLGQQSCCVHLGLGRALRTSRKPAPLLSFLSARALPRAPSPPQHEGDTVPRVAPGSGQEWRLRHRSGSLRTAASTRDKRQACVCVRVRASRGAAVPCAFDSTIRAGRNTEDERGWGRLTASFSPSQPAVNRPTLVSSSFPK